MTLTFELHCGSPDCFGVLFRVVGHAVGGGKGLGRLARLLDHRARHSPPVWLATIH